MQDRMAGGTASRSFPAWIRRRMPPPERTEPVRRILSELGLATVCQSARCPNIWECFAKGTATFMILGDVCTRGCRFCAVGKGKPSPLDAEEPKRVAEAARRLSLKHVVVTSVTRDDLPDGGAEHFARTIEALRGIGGVTVEVLTPDFLGDEEAIRLVVEARPDIYNHNVETVRRLYPLARPQADYERSLRVLAAVKEMDRSVLTKSGLMLGLGEETEEVRSAFADLRGAGCDALTIGQYLRPSPAHLPVERFVPPDEFETLETEARALGFRAVAAGPFVRSSYNAEHVFKELLQ